jgi:hypothetical protein
MARMNDARLKSTLRNKPTHIWTVVSVVDEKVSCSLHPSEYHAHRELVSRFESVELEPDRKSSELRRLLNGAVECGNYEQVRAYIKDNARRLDQLQLAEHPPLSTSTDDIDSSIEMRSSTEASGEKQKR